MPTYRLRAAPLAEDGTQGMPRIDDGINANSLEEAVAEVKETYTLDRLMDGSAVAWLVDPKGAMAWRVKLVESSGDGD